MASGLRFEAGEWYTETALRIAGLDGDVIAKAVRAGRLKCKQADGERLYRGEWLTAWLDGLPEPAGAGK